MKSHTGDKRHICTVCNKAFNTLYCLKIHKRQHTGETPHSCSVCEKGFADPKVLKQHIKIHTNEKAHLCSICGKGFRRMHHLKTHMITHSKGQTACNVQNIINNFFIIRSVLHTREVYVNFLIVLCFLSFILRLLRNFIIVRHIKVTSTAAFMLHNTS